MKFKKALAAALAVPVIGWAAPVNTFAEGSEAPQLTADILAGTWELFYLESGTGELVPAYDGQYPCWYAEMVFYPEEGGTSFTADCIYGNALCQEAEYVFDGNGIKRTYVEEGEVQTTIAYDGIYLVEDNEWYGEDVHPVWKKTGNMYGDLDGNNIIDGADASLILYANANGIDENLTDVQKKAADVNGDGLIDGVDASLILSYNSFCAEHGVNGFYYWKEILSQWDFSDIET
ncbi:MAG: hypothetical protein IJM44_00070 [Ruminococcus sp.]|nr:hypothetical protein [Ruminococcus sp.]